MIPPERNVARRIVQRLVDWALSFPMFIKILGIGVLAVGLFALLTLLLIRSSTTRSLQAILEKRASCTAAFLASQLETPLAAGDQAAVEEKLARIRQTHEDLRYVAVFDAQGRTVAHLGESPHAVSRKVEPTLGWYESPQGPIFTASEPIQGGQAGWLQVGLGDDLLDRQTAELTRLVLVGLAPGLLLAAGMAALLAHLVTRPIERLVQAANHIGEGKFDVRAEALCNDEIGHLAGAFNRMADRLAESHREVNEHQRTRQRLIERIVDSQEEERKRLSRELHDEVGQSLMALLLLVQGEYGREDTSGSFHSTLEKKIRQLAEEIHRLARGMRPSVLDHYGLDSALASYLDEVSRQSNIEIDYQSHGSPGAPRLPDRLEVTLFRIVQEAITNVQRHSQATRASVVILRQRDEVTVLVEDNGRGFETPAPERPAESRLGLTGIQERAALFDGLCTVESEPGRGTTLRVRIPLPEETLCLSAS
jgi:signal transduction histidine kinase